VPGAHNVIGALWDVSDASTPQLMDRMYAEIRKGKRPEEALRLAKLSMLHSDKRVPPAVLLGPVSVLYRVMIR